MRSTNCSICLLQIIVNFGEACAHRRVYILLQILRERERERERTINIIAKCYELQSTMYIVSFIGDSREGRQCSCARSLVDRFGDGHGKFGQLAKA